MEMMADTFPGAFSGYTLKVRRSSCEHRNAASPYVCKTMQLPSCINCHLQLKYCSSTKTYICATHLASY
jgi:hypothetical protein